MFKDVTLNLDWLNTVDTYNFEQKAIALFQYQFDNLPIYKSYCEYIGVQKMDVDQMIKIPFLPISFFKSHKILAQNTIEKLHFESSGTTGMVPSKHYIAHPAYYELAYNNGFKSFYGNPKDYIILGLLPSYLERNNSSLVYMVKDLITQSNQSQSGFYLNEWENLAQVITSKTDKKILLIGVTFGLLDFAEAFPLNLEHCIVMETGGMKGRREEWTRMEVHDFLAKQWNLKNVHSEYGMSEMLSQAYSYGNGIYKPSATMRVLLREENDPLETYTFGSGCVNVIDLANIDSCAFIATEDVGKVYADNSFEILGRRDSAALRGCSLMLV